MPTLSRSKQHSTPTNFQLVDTERGQLEIAANKYPGEIKENEEKVSADPSSSSSNSKHETNGGTAPAEPHSEFIVWWDEPEDQDPENPLNWSSARKWVNICSISVISFLV